MRNKGFTLIEVLIGLFIAVTASTYVAKTITSTNKVVAAGRETFIATNLAHEGIEFTRAMRDNTWFLDDTPTDRSEWMSQSGICGETSDTQPHHYTIDAEVVRDFVASKDPVPDDNVQNLYIQNNKLWSHNINSQPSGYKRLMTADCSHVSEDPAFVTITSTVSWVGQGGQTRSVIIKEEMYNWL